MNDCPQGIKNEKDIQRLEGHFAMLIEHLSEGIEKMDKKLDNLDKKFDTKIDKLDKKIEDMNNQIPEKIRLTVQEQLKSGVYGIVKFVIAALTVATIGAVVKIFIF